MADIIRIRGGKPDTIHKQDKHIVEYIFNLKVAVELNISLERYSRYGVEIMKEVYNDQYNLVLLPAAQAFFNRRINNLIVTKIIKSDSDYQKKLAQFHKENVKRGIPSADIKSRLATLKQRIIKYKSLKKHCPKLFNISKKLYSDVLADYTGYIRIVSS